MSNLVSTHYSFPGWQLIGAFPDGDPDDVGSWILSSGGEAMLLEVPEGLTVAHVKKTLEQIGKPKLQYVTASHDHCDHFDEEAWAALLKTFPKAVFYYPAKAKSVADFRMSLGGEPMWRISAPKHSSHDLVYVFRGVAMTGDIELGTLESVNDEVPLKQKIKSMKWLQGFEKRTGYHVHTTISAHLNDLRTNVNWASLFDW